MQWKPQAKYYPEYESTLAHELGHVFGLRHYFAMTDDEEKQDPAYGFHHDARHHDTIMNYGRHSKMTQKDRDDLKALYMGGACFFVSLFLLFILIIFTFSSLCFYSFPFFVLTHL